MSANLTFQPPTSIWAPGPSDLLRFIPFWPLLILEAAGESACARGCSGSFLYGTAQLVEWLFPITFLDTLAFLIPYLAVAWLIVRRLRPRRHRMFRWGSVGKGTCRAGYVEFFADPGWSLSL